MLLYVMRHGPAEDRATTGRDFDRVLTPEGRQVVARVARRFHEARLPLAGRPWRLLASPYRRALETATIVASTVASEGQSVEVETHDDLAADAGLPHALLGSLTAAATDAVLVGHQPTVEELVRELVRPAKVPLPGGFRTATIIALEQVEAGGWRMAVVIHPH